MKTDKATRLEAVVRSPTCIFIAALSVRLVVLEYMVITLGAERFYRQNEQARIASFLAAGEGFVSPWPHTAAFPTAQQPPLYPMLISLVFRVFGSYSRASLYALLVLAAVFSAITAVAVLRLGSELCGAKTGRVAAWLWAASAYEAALGERVWDASLSALLLVCALSIAYRIVQAPQFRDWVTLGVLAGLGALANTSLLAVFALLWVGLFFWTPWTGAQWRGLGASVGFFFLLIAPWTIRNYMAFGEIIPIRDNFGLELWVGNHAGIRGPVEFSGDFPLTDPSDYNRMGETAFMQAKKAEATAFIAQQPLHFMKMTAWRVYDFWGSPSPEIWLPLTLLAAVGWLILFRQSRIRAGMLAIPLLAFPLVYYVTHPFSTYRYPIEPVMILAAAHGLLWILKKTRARQEHPA